MIEKAIIPAARNGSQLQELTGGLPKEFIELGDKRMIDYSMEEELNSGIEDFGIIISHRKESIKKYLNDRYNQEMSEFFYQSEPLGLGDAIKYATEWVGDSFEFAFPDDVIISNEQTINKLKKVHIKYGRSVMSLTLSGSVERYGTVTREEIEGSIYLVKDLTEKPASGTVKSNMVIAGRYMPTDAIFEKLDCLNEKTGEIELTDALKKLFEQEDITLPSYLEGDLTAEMKKGLENI